MSPTSRLREALGGMASAKRGRERERWSRERLAAHQQQRLEALVAHAAERSRFWRERLPRGAVRLQELPTLDKHMLMEHFDAAATDPRLHRDELLAHLDGLDHDALYLDEFRVMTTSGSSGVKGLFVYDRAGWAEILGQFFRYTSWAGATPRLPRRRIAALVGAGPTHMTRRVSTTVDIGLHRVLAMPVTTPLDEIVARLNAFRPSFLNVFPSLAGLLVAEQEGGRLRIALDGLSTSSELCPPELAARLKAAFGVRPVNLYATTEGLWGCSCERPDGGIHLFEDRVIVENVDDDGRAVPPGEAGSRLLVTNLFNRVQPLIRFELGDRIALDPEPCRCGRTLARMKAIDGRTDDALRLGGAVVLPMHFAVVTADAAVRQFQVVQEGQAVRVRVVLDPAAETESTCRRLTERVAERLVAAGVAAPQVTVEPCPALAHGAGGKLRMIVADPAVGAPA